VNRFVAAGGPAGALTDANGVIRTADEYLGAIDLLEMTLEAQIGVAGGQQFGVDRAVRGVTGRATFPHGFMLENLRAVLVRVAAETALIFGSD